LEVTGQSPLSLFAPWLPFGPGRKCEKIREEIREIFREVIEGRKKEKSGVRHHDYLDILLNENNKRNGLPWEEVELMEKMVSIFFAATLNMIKVCFWTAINIYCREEVLDLMRKELDPIMESGGVEGPLPEVFGLERVKGVMKCELVENVLKESMRPLYGNVMVLRKTVRDVKYKEYVIPKGWHVSSSTQHFGKDLSKESEVVKEFLRDPNEFRLERWEKIRDYEDKKYLWLLFGGGEHRCKGEQFANMTMKMICSIMVTRYDIKWIDQPGKGTVPEACSPTFGPCDPKEAVWCTITKRVGV